MSTSNKTKYLTVVTYCIALVCILAAIFFPLGNMSAWSKDNLLFMMIPNALFEMLDAFGVTVTGLLTEVDFARSFTFTSTGYGANFMAFAVVLLAIIAVAGLLLLIPVIASKRESKVAAGCAYTVEALAVIVLTLYALMNVFNYTWGSGELDWSIIGIGLGGTALMLVIQSVYNKGGSGVMKLIMAVLGVVGIAALLNLPVLTEGNINAITISNSTISVAFADGLGGLDAIYSFFCYAFEIGTVNFLGAYGDSVLITTTSVFLFATAIVAVINFLLDVAAVGKNTGRVTLIVDMARYAFEAVLAIVTAVLVFCMNVDGFKPGLLMYLLIAVVVIQLIVSAVRCILFRKREETVYTAPASTACYDDTAPIIPVYQSAYAPAPANYAAPVAPAPVYVHVTAPTTAPAPMHVVNTAANYMTYNGPIDAFIARLSEPEKIEFSKLFLEKINGSYPNVPDYVVGGDNKEFFIALFIYLGKFRPMMSDGLMNKIYNELNLLT